MKRILSFAALLGLLAAAPIKEAAAVRILGQGTDKCSSWLKARKGPEAKEYREWFLGYLSASAFLKDHDVLRNMTYDSVLARVLIACENDPDRRLDNVLDDFFR